LLSPIFRMVLSRKLWEIVGPVSEAPQKAGEKSDVGSK